MNEDDMCQASNAAVGTPSSASPLQSGDGAVVKCAVSHLPAGHPNACCDCDPCLLHDRRRQLEALQQDWERMYWENKALLAEKERLRKALKPFAELGDQFNLHAHDDSWTIYDIGARQKLVLGDLRRARGALWTSFEAFSNTLDRFIEDVRSTDEVDPEN